MPGLSSSPSSSPCSTTLTRASACAAWPSPVPSSQNVPPTACATQASASSSPSPSCPPSISSPPSPPKPSLPSSSTPPTQPPSSSPGLSSTALKTQQASAPFSRQSSATASSQATCTPSSTSASSRCWPDRAPPSSTSYNSQRRRTSRIWSRCTRRCYPTPSRQGTLNTSSLPFGAYRQLCATAGRASPLRTTRARSSRP
ncbi:hypothetical protein B0T11DRAFT_130137 [Plectosphaerella cucumerina]|uniref:Uncharacterized protein n=1 Tax=Plectosphaerella cucumerina TaxID=40658 RepID=A0A8K0WZM4_9PEZI|nr:hypothetical protein B0T11DRAFT_130137 [Plectosphaerella cucumerina]